MVGNKYEEIGIAKQRFSYYFFIFRLGGVPLYLSNYSKLYQLFCKVMIFCAYFTTLAMILDVIKHINHVKNAMANIQSTASVLGILWTDLWLRYRRPKLVKLIRLTNSFEWEDLPKKDPVNGSTTMAAIVPRVKTFLQKIYTYVLLFHLCYTVILYASRITPMKTNYIFDITYSPLFEIVIMSQTCGSVMLSSVYFGSQALCGLFVSIACSQLEKFRINLRLIKLKQASTYRGVVSETDEGNTTPNEFFDVQQQFKDCIRHHQDIIRYMQLTEEVLSPILLGQFFSSTCCICLSIFSAIMNWGDIVLMSQAVLIYFLNMIQLSMYCSLGEELTHQAEIVTDAAWECDWLGTPLPLQRCLVFVMAAGNKPFFLSAGKFVPVNKKTLINVFNQALSFLMFLLHVKDMNGH